MILDFFGEENMTLDKCDRIDGLELIAVGEDRFRMDEIFVDIAKG